MADESGRPGTSRSKVGWPAIEEPCTNSTVPLVWAGSPSHLFHRNSFTLSSLVVQCSAPVRRCGDGAVSFMAAILRAVGRIPLSDCDGAFWRSLRFDVVGLDELGP